MNDFARHLRPGTAFPVVDLIERLGQPDVLCLQELRLRASDRELVRIASEVPGYSFSYALANDPKNAGFRGGRAYGVGTYVRTSLAPLTLTRLEWDREGRLAITLLADWQLAIVNAYAVNGTSKAHWDHELNRYEGTRHHWKRRFHELVAQVGRRLRTRGFDLLLIGDWNISQAAIDTTPRLRTEAPHAAARSHFAEVVVRDLDLVDVFRALHPERRAYTWFANKEALDAARVDFALLSRSRLADVVEAEVADGDRGAFGSDHAPISLTLQRVQSKPDVRGEP